MRPRSIGGWKAQFIVGLVFTAASLLLLWGGWYAYSSSQPFADGVMTVGTVETVTASEPDDDGGRTYRVAYSFITEDGERIFIQESLGTGGVTLTEGDSVEVSYQPWDPAGARRMGSPYATLGFILFAFSGITGLAGILSVVGGWRKRTRTGGFARFIRESERRWDSDRQVRKAPAKPQADNDDLFTPDYEPVTMDTIVT